MSTGIQRISPTTELVLPPQFTFQDMREMSEYVAKSRLFGMDQPSILTLMMIAQSEGQHPVQALLRWDIIDGRPAKKAATILAEFQAKGGVVEWGECTDASATATFSHPKHCPKPLTVRYTIDNAKRAGLNHKKNWLQNPEDMLVWRVAVRGVRRVLPGSIVGIYDPDELPEAPAAAEQQAQTSLAARLAGCKEPTRTNGHGPAPVENVVAELKAHEEAQKPFDSAQGRPPQDTRSDCRQWIEDTLAAFNAELEKAYPGTKSIHSNQVLNHTINEAVKLGLTNELLITRADGKRDTRSIGREINRLWNMDELWCMKEIGAYLSSKLPQLVPAGGGEDDEIPDDITDGFPKGAA